MSHSLTHPSSKVPAWWGSRIRLKLGMLIDLRVHIFFIYLHPPSTAPEVLLNLYGEHTVVYCGDTVRLCYHSPSFDLILPPGNRANPEVAGRWNNSSFEIITPPDTYSHVEKWVDAGDRTQVGRVETQRLTTWLYCSVLTFHSWNW